MYICYCNYATVALIARFTGPWKYLYGLICGLNLFVGTAGSAPWNIVKSGNQRLKLSVPLDIEFRQVLGLVQLI